MSKNLKYVFLFILDSVRKDHCGVYGYPRNTTPNFKKLANNSDVYDWAFSPSSYTLSAFPAILGGKYPTEMSHLFTGCKKNGGKLSQQDFNSTKLLSELGYKTALFTTNLVTSSHYININEYFDHHWGELPPEKEFSVKGEVAIKEVMSYIKKNAKQKLFVVIHLMEAHGPYAPYLKSKFTDDQIYKSDHRELDRVVPDTFTGVTREILNQYTVVPKYQLMDIIQGPNGIIEDFERQIKKYISQYDMGIFQLDNLVGKFLAFLEKRKLYNHSEIIITSDHGELLGEENIFFSHGIFTHPSLSLVPLIIKKPYQHKSHSIKENVTLIDIIPSIIDINTDNATLSRGSEKDVPSNIYIFHPQSLSVVYKDNYISYHQGPFQHTETEGENIFPTQSSRFKQINAQLSRNKERDRYLKQFSKGKIKFHESPTQSINKETINMLISGLIYGQKTAIAQLN